MENNMTKEEMDEYLKSIGGLEHGYFADRKITDSYFFDIGEGWYPLVKELIEKLIAAGWDKQTCQVKEKFGGLRFYINSANDECFNLISQYEKLSCETCEKCGNPGTIRKGGWISTLCDEHSDGREPYK